MSATTPLTPPFTANASLSVLYRSVAILAVAIPLASAKAIQKSLRFWDEFRTAFGVLTITAWAIAAYLVLRAAPPVDTPLPEWTRQTVSPFTASAEAGCLKRHLRDLSMSRTLEGDDLALLLALGSDLVRRIRASLGASIRRAKTKKLPILWHMVSEALQATCGGLISRLSPEQLRNFTIVAVGLAAGLRRSEIAALQAQHLCRGAESGFVVIIMQDKTNRCAGPHSEPRSIPINQPLACDLISLYLERSKARLVPGAPLFANLQAGAKAGSPIAPGTINSVIRKLFPGTGVVAHSLRVGFATELRAAGVPVELILEMGRWSSLRGLLYILPSVEQMQDASRSMGSGVIHFSSLALYDKLTKQALAFRAAAVPALVPASGSSAAGVAAASGARRSPSPEHRSPAEGCLPPQVVLALRLSAARSMSWTSGNCWRCGVEQGRDDGIMCDHDDEDGSYCRQVLCDECWPHGSGLGAPPLFCRQHRKGRRRPRNAKGEDLWTSESDGVPARCDGTNAGDRLRRQRLRMRAADEADTEREARRLLGQRHDGGDGAAGGSSAAPARAAAGDAGHLDDTTGDR